MHILICIAIGIVITAAFFAALIGLTILTNRAWNKPDRLWKKIARPCIIAFTVTCILGTVTMVTLTVCMFH